MGAITHEDEEATSKMMCAQNGLSACLVSTYNGKDKVGRCAGPQRVTLDIKVASELPAPSKQNTEIENSRDECKKF